MAYALLLVAVAFFGLVPEAHAAVSGRSCDCYRTSANDVFTDYTFYDFRNVKAPSSAPEISSTLPSSADDETGQSSSAIGTLQSGFLSSNEWNSSWAIQDWGKGVTNDTKYRMWNSFSTVYIDGNNTDGRHANTKLVLKTKRFQNFQMSAEVENAQKNLFYASTRIRARVVGNDGAVAGLFYYRNDNNESDIEILTRDESSSIRYSNQPVVDDDGNEIENSSTQVDLASNLRTDGTNLTDKRRRRGVYGDFTWEDWHTHRIDWVDGKSSWYLDGKHVLDKTYGVPTTTAYLVLNMWSDGGVWSGEMEVDGEARLEIEWVEMAYNTSGAIDESDDDDSSSKRKRADSGTCSHVCTVDDETPGSAACRNSAFWSGLIAAVLMSVVLCV